MPVISLLLTMLVVAIVCLLIDYIIGQVTPDARIRTVARVILAIIALIWFLQASGLV